MKKFVKLLSILSFIIVTAAGLTAAIKTEAADNKVEIGEIDYENLTMQVVKKDNSIIYLSTDGKKSWNEVNGVTKNGILTMDISFAPATANVTLYFKGNKDMTVASVVLPKQSTSFKAKYDKVNDEMVFSGYDDRDGFYWRKSTDYNWAYVEFANDGDVKKFNETLASMRFKGTKVAIKLGQIKGTSADNTGDRPTKEITVSIPKYASAPNIALNVLKLVLNTKSTMEYRTSPSDTWKPCSKNMPLKDILPNIVNGTSNDTVTLQFRTAATEKQAVSLTKMLVVKGRAAAPTIGDSSSSISCIKANDDLSVTFNGAKKSSPIEYCVVTPDNTLDETTAKWKTMTSTKTVVLKARTAPVGSTVYFRFKGVTANTTKGIEMQLPSKLASYKIQ